MEKGEVKLPPKVPENEERETRRPTFRQGADIHVPIPEFTDAEKTASLKKIGEHLEQMMTGGKTPTEEAISTEYPIPMPVYAAELEIGPTRELIPAFSEQAQSMYYVLYEAVESAKQHPLNKDGVVSILSDLESNIAERIALLQNDAEVKTDQEYNAFLHRALGEVRIVLKQSRNPEAYKKSREAFDWFLREALFRLEAQGLLPIEHDEKMLDNPDKVVVMLRNSPHLDEDVKKQLVKMTRGAKARALAWASPIIAMSATSVAASGYLAYAATVLKLGPEAWAIMGVVGSTASIMTAWGARIIYKSHTYANLKDGTIKVMKNFREKTLSNWFPKITSPKIKSVVEDK